MKHVRFEIEVVHPATMLWLTTNRCPYEHHKKLPDGSIPDFMFYKDGLLAVGECKQDRANWRGSINQVLRYKRISGASEAYLFMPASEAYPKYGQSIGDPLGDLDKAGVKAVLLDIPDNKAKLFSTITPEAFGELSALAKGMNSDFSTILLALVNAQKLQGESAFDAGQRICAGLSL